MESISFKNKVTLTILMLSLFIFCFNVSFALKIYVEPNAVYELPAIITFSIYNNEDKVYHLYVDSYLLSSGSQEFFTTTSFDLQPNRIKVIKRYFPKLNLNNGILIWKIYGDVHKIVKVPIKLVKNMQESNQESNVELNEIKNKDKSGNNQEEHEKAKKETNLLKNLPNKAELCKGIVYLFSPTRGVSKIFNSDEKILLNIDYNDAVKTIISDWKIKPISDDVFELIFPDKFKPSYNKLIIKFEHCGNQTLEFFIKNPKNDSLFLLTIILILVIIFIAFYAELAYLDHKKTHERIHRMIKRNTEIKNKIKTKNIKDRRKKNHKIKK